MSIHVCMCVYMCVYVCVGWVCGVGGCVGWVGVWGVWVCGLGGWCSILAY